MDKMANEQRYRSEVVVRILIGVKIIGLGVMSSLDDRDGEC